MGTFLPFTITWSLRCATLLFAWSKCRGRSCIIGQACCMYLLKVLATHLWCHVEPVYFPFYVLLARVKSVLSSTTDCSFKLFLLLIYQALHFFNKLVQFTPPLVHFWLEHRIGCFTGICCEHLGWTTQTCSLYSVESHYLSMWATYFSVVPFNHISCIGSVSYKFVIVTTLLQFWRLGIWDYDYILGLVAMVSFPCRIWYCMGLCLKRTVHFRAVFTLPTML